MGSRSLSVVDPLKPHALVASETAHRAAEDEVDASAYGKVRAPALRQAQLLSTASQKHLKVDLQLQVAQEVLPCWLRPGA